MLRSMIAAVIPVLFLTIAHADPTYNDKGELLLPKGYETWVFVGANLGLGYVDGREGEVEEFHNVYMETEAYLEFMETGKFRDPTIFLFEAYSKATRLKSGIINAGAFNDQLRSIEVAVKDRPRPTREGSVENWAYYIFGLKNGVPVDSALAHLDKTCWQCHADHAGYDHVWTQLYPRLRNRLAQ